jgi:hypothetical protein
MRTTKLATITLVCVVVQLGCGKQASDPELQNKEAVVNRAEGQNMNGFIIGNTEFGIDPKQSRFQITKEKGRLFLSVEIHGDDAVSEKLGDDEKSGWEGILYGPYFYLRQYPVESTGKDKELTVKLKPGDVENFDVALYLMEHNLVKDVQVKILNEQIEVTGEADLAGFRKPWTRFRINWKQKGP